MELDFDKVFKIPTKCMKLGLTHPNITRDKKWALKFFIIQCLNTLNAIILAYNIICHDMKAKNFSQICQNGVILTVYLVNTLQSSVLLWYRDTLLGLINDMKRDYEQTKDMTSAEKDLIYKNVNLGIWVCKLWLVMGSLGAGTFAVKSLILMFYYYCINEFRLVPYHNLVYPSIIEENNDSIYVFLLKYAVIGYFGCYSAFTYIGFVPLGPIFVLHACGQLELVKLRIDDLFSECDDEVIRRKLKIIIIQMQYIKGFVNRIQQIFKFAHEATLKGTTVILPITSYELVEMLHRGEVSLEFLTFLFGSILISSTPCYYSDLLMEKGEEVRQALYICGWERHYDRRTRTTLQLMLQNALRPIALQSVFRVLCLEALTDLFQQSYALFSLMNAMWN